MKSDCNRVYRVLQGTGFYNVLQSTGLYWGILLRRGYRGLLQCTGSIVGYLGYWGVLGSNTGYWSKTIKVVT